MKRVTSVLPQNTNTIIHNSTFTTRFLSSAVAPAAAPSSKSRSKDSDDSSAAHYNNHETHADSHTSGDAASKSGSQEGDFHAPKKTMAQLDEELQNRMAGMSGDGGESGVEMEGGKPKGMGRSVKDNMFRYI